MIEGDYRRRGQKTIFRRRPRPIGSGSRANVKTRDVLRFEAGLSEREIARALRRGNGSVNALGHFRRPEPLGAVSRTWVKTRVEVSRRFADVGNYWTWLPQSTRKEGLHRIEE